MADPESNAEDIRHATNEPEHALEQGLARADDTESMPAVVQVRRISGNGDCSGHTVAVAVAGEEVGEKKESEEDKRRRETKERKIASLQSRNQDLEAQVAVMKEDIAVFTKGLKSSNPSQTVKTHIKLLHEYNEIRDVGQGIIGLIADNRGVRIGDVYEEFGVGRGD